MLFRFLSRNSVTGYTTVRHALVTCISSKSNIADLVELNIKGKCDRENCVQFFMGNHLFSQTPWIEGLQLCG